MVQHRNSHVTVRTYKLMVMKRKLQFDRPMSRTVARARGEEERRR